MAGMYQYLIILFHTSRTTLAVAGSNFAVAIADDRVSKGYSICTRKGSKITQLYALLEMIVIPSFI